MNVFRIILLVTLSVLLTLLVMGTKSQVFTYFVILILALLMLPTFWRGLKEILEGTVIQKIVLIIFSLIFPFYYGLFGVRQYSIEFLVFLWLFVALSCFGVYFLYISFSKGKPRYLMIIGLFLVAIPVSILTFLLR